MGGNSLSATLEPVALAVHFQDMDVVRETVQQCAGQLSDPKTSVHSSKDRLVVSRMELVLPHFLHPA